MTNTPQPKIHGEEGGLYYPSQGSYGLADAVGLTNEQRKAVHDELRACYQLARTEEREGDSRWPAATEFIVDSPDDGPEEWCSIDAARVKSPIDAIRAAYIAFAKWGMDGLG